MSDDKSKWPQWLREAKTENANVEIRYGRVIWYGGHWRDGVWQGGVWHGGDWGGGHWRVGVWLGGRWRGGKWYDKRINRLLFHASLCGIVFDSDGYAVAYRSTRADGRGRYDPIFQQPEGEYYEDDVALAGAVVYRNGIHVTSQGQALTYFGIDPDAQLWKVRFHRDDLLDCDGQKARIRGGVFTKIEWPFFNKEARDE